MSGIGRHSEANEKSVEFQSEDSERRRSRDGGMEWGNEGRNVEETYGREGTGRKSVNIDQRTRSISLISMPPIGILDVISAYNVVGICEQFRSGTE